MNTLSDRAMLAGLSLTSWSARKLDRKATERFNREQNASADAGRYNKLLIAEQHLKSLTQTDSAIRAEHYRLTLPWSDDGLRILPAKAFFEYRQKMSDFRVEREKVVAEFISAYPSLVADARHRLNGLFNPADYPEADRIQARFTFNVKFTPLPTGEDFRVTLGDEELSRIREEIDRNTREALSAGMRDAWNRLYEAVRHAAERLGDPKAIFRDSLIGNIRDLVGLLPALNVTDDPNLETLRREVERTLAQVAPDDCRQSPLLREKTAQIARNLTADIQQAMNATDGKAAAMAAFMG